MTNLDKILDEIEERARDAITTIKPHTYDTCIDLSVCVNKKYVPKLVKALRCAYNAMENHIDEACHHKTCACYLCLGLKEIEQIFKDEKN